MSYQIDPHVDIENHHRCHSPERYYINQLEARGMLIRLDNVLVDAEQLVLRNFACDSHYCLRCSGEGAAKKYKGCCCTDLEVDLTPAEVEKLKELGELAAERIELSPRDPLSRVIRHLAAGDYTEVTDKGDIAIEHTRSGRCPLSVIDREGIYRCGINLVCAQLGLPLNRFKPDPCYLFPLHYVEVAPGEYFMTVISQESHEYIGADAYVTKLRCLSKPKPGAPPAYQFLKWEIVHCFGEALYGALEKAAQPLLARNAAEAGA